jgi:hypothetical protein
VTFWDDKKGKVLGTDVIKVNDLFTLNDVTLVDKLRYNLFSISQLVDANLSVLFPKSDSRVLDSSSGLVCCFLDWKCLSSRFFICSVFLEVFAISVFLRALKMA